jgi:hypothetical protein
MPRARRIPARLSFEKPALKPAKKKAVVVHRIVTDKDRACVATSSSSSAAEPAVAAAPSPASREMRYLNPAFFMHGVMSVPVTILSRLLIVVIRKAENGDLVVEILDADHYGYVRQPHLGTVWLRKQADGTYKQRAADGYKIELDFHAQCRADEVQIVFDRGTSYCRCATIPRECIDRVEYDQVRPAVV